MRIIEGNYIYTSIHKIKNQQRVLASLAKVRTWLHQAAAMRSKEENEIGRVRVRAEQASKIDNAIWPARRRGDILAWRRRRQTDMSHRMWQTFIMQAVRGREGFAMKGTGRVKSIRTNDSVRVECRMGGHGNKWIPSLTVANDRFRAAGYCSLTFLAAD